MATSQFESLRLGIKLTKTNQYNMRERERERERERKRERERVGQKLWLK
jgi:hypothetical protein